MTKEQKQEEGTPIASVNKAKKVWRWVGTGMVAGAILSVGIVGSPKFSHFLPGQLGEEGFFSTAHATNSPVDLVSPVSAFYTLNPLATAPQEQAVQTWQREVIADLQINLMEKETFLLYGVKKEGTLGWESVGTLYDGAKNILYVENQKEMIKQTIQSNAQYYVEGEVAPTPLVTSSLVDGELYALLIVEGEIIAVTSVSKPYEFTGIEEMSQTPLDFITEEQHQILANLTALAETNYEMEDRPMLLANPGCNVSTGTYPDSYIISQAR